ncbi:MAG: von Willebrand factor type A domain-containing protein [Ardenticatenaceae bacterium]|nr:von Willebrand factor type A domain-containing protein [Ardenticatenaceae bacterium]
MFTQKFKWVLFASLIALILAACQPQVVEVEVSRTVSETVTEVETMDDDAMEVEYVEEVMDAEESEPLFEEVSGAEPEQSIEEAGPGTMIFENYGINPFVATSEDNLSTFAIDVDTGSYTVMRNYINDGLLPPSDAVRVEEFVNYFDYEYPNPESDSFEITVQGAPAPGLTAEDGRYLVQVGLQGYAVPAAERPDGMFIFVVDVSGSMDQENRLGLVRRSLHMLVDNLRGTDRVGIVIYGSSAQTLLEPTAVSDEETIRRGIDRLQPGGSTNAEQGIMMAYRLADQYARPGEINRLILASDGVANVGNTTAEAILEYATEGIQLSSFGFGMGNYNDVFMEQLANQGDGSYAYIDTMDEAERVFEDQLLATILTIAKDAKIQVEFNSAVVSEYRLLGYENRDVADEDFRNDAVDAGEIGAGHSVTALYEVVLVEEANPAEAALTVRLRYEDLDTGEVLEIAESVASGDFATAFSEATPTFQLAAAVSQYAELLRNSPYATTNWDAIALEARRIAEYMPQDEDVQEFSTLVQQAAELAPVE